MNRIRRWFYLKNVNRIYKKDVRRLNKQLEREMKREMRSNSTTDTSFKTQTNKYELEVETSGGVEWIKCPHVNILKSFNSVICEHIDNKNKTCNDKECPIHFRGSGGEKGKDDSRVAVRVRRPSTSGGENSSSDSKLPEPISLGEYHANWLTKLEEGQATTEPEKDDSPTSEDPYYPCGKEKTPYHVRSWEHGFKEGVKHNRKELIEAFLSDLNSDMIKKHIIEKWQGRIK